MGSNYFKDPQVKKTRIFQAPVQVFTCLALEFFIVGKRGQVIGERLGKLLLSRFIGVQIPDFLNKSGIYEPS
jgi:hypothetical protein